MQTPPKTGTTYEIEFPVERSHSIDLAGGQMPAVLSTPSLILFLERAALELLRPYLDEGEITVGVQIELEHLAASLLGQKVQCRARAIHSEGPLVSFQIEAHDEHELVARGLHKRRVVRIDRLRERLRRKSR